MAKDVQIRRKPGNSRVIEFHDKSGNKGSIDFRGGEFFFDRPISRNENTDREILEAVTINTDIDANSDKKIYLGHKERFKAYFLRFVASRGSVCAGGQIYVVTDGTTAYITREDIGGNIDIDITSGVSTREFVYLNISVGTASSDSLEFSAKVERIKK